MYLHLLTILLYKGFSPTIRVDLSYSSIIIHQKQPKSGTRVRSYAPGENNNKELYCTPIVHVFG